MIFTFANFFWRFVDMLCTLFGLTARPFSCFTVSFLKAENILFTQLLKAISQIKLMKFYLALSPYFSFFAALLASFSSLMSAFSLSAILSFM